MKVFDLQCANGHIFEGWFESENDFVKQKESGLLVCPVCDSHQVNKILSSFAIKKSISSSSGNRDGNGVGITIGKYQTDTAEFVADMAHKIKKYVERNFDDVGCDFAREAIKMHYGVSEPRNIRGVSTPEEDKMLQKEGVNFAKITLPTKHKPDSDA
jgi:hypothetical protein